MRLEEINAELIDDDPKYNGARGQISPSDVEWLSEDIHRNGLLQPVVVRPVNGSKPFRLVAGFCRFMALRVLMWPKIPCVVLVGCTDFDAQLYNVNENLKRKNLSVLQEAMAINALLNLNPLLSEYDLAEKLGQSRGWVQIRKYVLSLPQEIQDDVGKGYLTSEQIRAVWQIPDKFKQYEMVKRLKEAKQRGERINLLKLIKKPKSNSNKEERDRPSIFLMMGHIQEHLGNNFGTRCLAWCAGEISDFELYHDIKNIMEHEGKDYIIPETTLEAKHI